MNTERHVLDFALTLCGRVVEAQHLENEVLVLDVRLLDQFLETVPVLTVSGSVDVQARILQQLGNDFLTGLAARLRQFVVEFHGAIGRSITLHGDVLRSTVVLQFGIYVSLERVEVGFLLVLLGYDRRVDRIEQIGLVDDGGHLLVVVGHRSHQVGVFQILLERVQAVSYGQAEFLGQSGLGSLVVTGQHGSLLLGRDGAGVQVHEREFLALAARALDLGAELQGALVHTGIVGELYVLREIASVLLVDDRVVLVDFRTLEIFGGTGNLATVEYDHGSYFDNGFRVEILNRERNIDVSGNDTVVQRQNLGGNRQVDVIPVLGHLLEAITAREYQCGSYEHNAQFH